MRVIRVMLLGAGNFGSSWVRDILPLCAAFARLAAVTDRDPARLKAVSAETERYTDLEEALTAVRPDLVINATQPDAHLETNRILLEKGFLVLCEKPMADSLEAAEETGEILNKTNGFLMIGENYRYGPVMRTARAYLESGGLGSIHRICCLFRHEHADFSQFYHGRLKHPLLEDVTIHHLDLARYLSGREPVNVDCRVYTAPYSWYGERFASAGIRTEMTDGVIFEYSGTLASPVSTTTWNGFWEIECENGVLQIADDRLYAIRGDGRTEIPVTHRKDESRAVMLREACAALREGRRGETDYADNIRSYRWMQAAIKASNEQGSVSI